MGILVRISDCDHVPAATNPVSVSPVSVSNISLLGVTALACLFGLPSPAHAAFIPPAGVADYRLIFATSGTTAAASSAIGTYNTFATTQAALDTSLPSTIWTAVASTDTVSAINNIACTPGCSNVPIYLVSGTEVAASSTALFTAATTSLLSGINQDQFGNALVGRSLTSNYVWTGSTSAGARNIQTIGATVFDATLGSPATTSGYGSVGQVNGTAIDFGSVSPQLSSARIYAISGVISAGQPVPEPVSASLLTFGAIVTGWIGRRRGGRKPGVAV